METILGTLTVGVAFVKSRRVQWVNAAYQKMFGYGDDENTALKTLVFYADEEGYQRVGTEGYAQLAKGEVYSTELEMKRKDGTRFWCALIGRAVNPQDYTEGSIWMFQDITERKHTEDSLRESQTRFQAIFEQSNDGINVADLEGRFVMVNPAFCAITGFTKDELLKLRIYDIMPDHVKPQLFPQVIAQKVSGRRDTELKRKDGSTFMAAISGSILQVGKDQYVQGIIQDITERKQAQDERETMVEFLRLVNDCRGTSELVRAATEFFQQRSGCEAVGLRLHKKGDYPYFETRNFSTESVQMESSLCSSDKQGDPMVDSICNPFLECMCGNVICGRFDPSKPFFTKRGSFWTKSTTEMLATTTETDRQAWTRNRCHGEGYESVALIGLTLGKERLGLLQLNDKRKGRFNLALITLWERLADNLAVALAKLRADEALHESEEKYRLLFDSSRDALMTLAPPTWKFTRANSAALKLFGVASEAEFTALGPWELSPQQQPDGRPSAETALERIETAVRDGSCFFEWEHQRLHGKPFAADVLLTRVEVDGKISMQATVRNISERKQLEEERKRLSSLLEATQSVARVGGWEIDVEHNNSVYWTPETYKIYDISPEEHVPTLETSLSFYAPEYSQLLLDSFNSAIEHGKADDAEVELITAKGRRIWVHVAAHVVQQGNKTVKVIGAIQDISERKHFEDRLSTWANVFEKASWGVAIDSHDGKRLELVNPAYAKMHGYTVDELTGFLITNLVAPEIKKHIIKNQASISTEGYITTNTIHVRKDGTIFPCMITVTAMKDKDGSVMRRIMHIQDMTSYSKLENQLLQAQKMEAIGVLAGGIAHDFNNILTAIMGSGHLLNMKTKESDPLRVYIEQILTSAERAAELTHGLLAFSRKQVINAKPSDVNKIIFDLRKMLDRIIGEDIEFKVKTTEKPLSVLADKGQIGQVLMNLATNARDAMPDGGVLEITTEEVAVDKEFTGAYRENIRIGTYAVISVRDTGSGIDRGTMDRIFEPFFTTKNIGKGTGLGLSIAYGIVKQHDGYINVSSEPSKGTIFEIYLPLISVEEIKPVIPDSTQIVKGRGTILLVEDDPTTRDVTKQMLEIIGYTVIDADNVESAFKLFQQYVDIINLVVSDVIMPKQSGIDLRNHLITIKPSVKILFISGYPADIVGGKGIDGLALNYMPKPLDMVAFSHKIRELIENKKDV